MKNAKQIIMISGISIMVMAVCVMSGYMWGSMGRTAINTVAPMPASSPGPTVPVPVEKPADNIGKESAAISAPHDSHSPRPEKESPKSLPEKNRDNLNPYCRFVDQDILEKFITGLESDDADKVLHSIEFFANFGSDMADEMLKQYVDKSLEPEIRAAAIHAINWSGKADELYELYANEMHPDVQSAIIISADLTEMEDAQREEFNGFFYNSIAYEKNAQVIANLLTYIENREPFSIPEAYAILMNRKDLDSDTIHFMESMIAQSPVFESMPNEEKLSVSEKLKSVLVSMQKDEIRDM